MKRKILTIILCIILVTFNGASASVNNDNVPSSWAVSYVNAAITANLVPKNLQSDYTQAITRAEFCTLAVALYEKVADKVITDRHSFNDTADVDVEKAAAIGIVSGIGSNTFVPNDKLTREQAAVILTRLSDVIGTPIPMQSSTFNDNHSISAWAFEQVGQIQMSGIMTGVGNNMFAPKDPYTREQSIITLMRLHDYISSPVNVQFSIVDGASLYINDTLQQVAIYKNNFFESTVKEYVPLQICMEALGCTFEQTNPTKIIIKTPDNRIINMHINETTISYTGGIRNVSRVPWEYFVVNGVIYYPFYEFPELIDCEILLDGRDIYLDSGEYLRQIYGNINIGRKVNLDVYLNDIKIETPVYSNRNALSVPGTDSFSDYVHLKPFLEALDIDLASTIGWYYFLGDPIDIDGEIYVPFSVIRYNINGSIKQNDHNSMYLYSTDYIRQDIPATLEEAYKALDNFLDPEYITYVKQLEEDDIISLHLGLGMWIRNKWLYPSNSRLTKLLLELNPEFGHQDNMSHFILIGYHRYLNNKPSDFDSIIILL